MKRAAFVLIVLAGCAEVSGLDGLGVCDGACADVTVDSPASNDAQADVGVDGGGDGSGDSAVADVKNDVIAISDGAIIPCDKPSDCSGATSVCCETATLSGGNFPPCDIDADTISCMAPGSCPTTIAFACSGTDKVRRCSTNADCTESSYPKCCTIPFKGDASREFCATAGIASLAGGTCQ